MTDDRGTEVELPDGSRKVYHLKALPELKKQVSDTIGVEDEDDVSFIDNDGHIVRERDPLPQTVQVVPKPKWGSDIDEWQLACDMLAAMESRKYGDRFRIKLLKPNVFDTFRVYLNYEGIEYPLRVEIEEYPFSQLPSVTFERYIPPCPKHPESWHPNVWDDGRVCWGEAETNVLPGTTIVGFLNTLVAFLHKANHKSPVPDRCA
jgi:hypothetical protein